MRIFCVFLRFSGLVFLTVSALHVFMGLGADALLGANVSATSIVDPSLDSQNRFFGAAFALYGMLLIVTSTDFHRYYVVLQCTFGSLFIAGLARVLSLLLKGVPSDPILLLLFSELVIPPIVWFWMMQIGRKQGVEDASKSGRSG